MAVLAGAAIAGAACSAAVTSCDSAEPKFEPTVHKNLKDPMTIYAKNAIRRQTERLHALEEKHEDKQEQQPAQQTGVPSQAQAIPTVTSEPKASLQATSSQQPSVDTQPQQQIFQTTTTQSAQATSPTSVDMTLAPAQPPQMTADEVRIEEKTRWVYLIFICSVMLNLERNKIGANI